jgi:hypothetical protein
MIAGRAAGKVTSVDGAQTVTVRVPLALRRYGGRKAVVVPNETQPVARRQEPLSPLVRALARAYRWQKLIETGEFPSIAELAASERIDKSYVSKILRLTLLAPDLVELILAGTQPNAIQIDALKRPFSPDWSRQRRCLLGRTGLAHVAAN